MSGEGEQEVVLSATNTAEEEEQKPDEKPSHPNAAADLAGIAVPAASLPELPPPAFLHALDVAPKLKTTGPTVRWD